MSSDGTVEKPTLTVSNIDAQASALIRAYNGLMQAKVTVWVLVKELLQNDGSVKEGDFRRFVYYIERPKQVDPQKATFELTSVFDMDGLMIGPPNANRLLLGAAWVVQVWQRLRLQRAERILRQVRKQGRRSVAGCLRRSGFFLQASFWQ